MKFVCLFVLLAALLALPGAGKEEEKPPCPRPEILVQTDCYDENTSLIVVKTDGEILRNVYSLRRLPPIGDLQEVEVFFDEEEIRSEIFDIDSLDYMSYESVGPGCQPLRYPIRKCRVYWEILDVEEKKTGIPLFVELGGAAMYDLYSDRDDIESLLYGGEASLGVFLSEKVGLAAGAGPLIEGDRYYFPAKGEIRLYPWGRSNESILKRLGGRYGFTPSACRFINPRDTNSVVIPEPEEVGKRKWRKDPVDGEIDSTVIYSPLSPTVILKEHGDVCKPYLYVEGGYIFDGDFEGARKSAQDPYEVINPEDYGQYLFGVGIGSNFFKFFNVSVGYRYMRLNFQTECFDENCFKNMINTNYASGIYARLGFHYSFD